MSTQNDGMVIKKWRVVREASFMNGTRKGACIALHMGIDMNAKIALFQDAHLEIWMQN